jgi:uncharacterized protein (TIGR00369 family)
MQAGGHGTKRVRIRVNRCFGCGAGNPGGMRLKFTFDEGKHRAYCRFRLPKRFQGPPGHVHGGIIATILDEAMSKVNKLRSVLAPTAKMTVQFLRPVPLGKPLMVEGWEQSVRGRKHVNLAEIRNAAGDILARGRGLFIAVDPKRFAKYLK